MKRRTAYKLGRSRAKGNAPYTKHKKAKYLYSWEIKKKAE